MAAVQIETERMKSDIQFSADNDGNIVVTQITTMTPREFLNLAGEVYQFASPPNISNPALAIEAKS